MVYRIDCGVQDPWWHIWQIVLHATQSTLWHAGVVHHYIALGLLWRVTCSWGPGQTNAGAKSIFRCEENLNAPRRWWAPSSSSVLSILAENLWGEIHKLTSECYGSMPWILRMEDNMCWTFPPYGLWLRRRLYPFRASCIWDLFVFVFLVTGISLDHMVGRVRGGWVQLWSLVPFSFKTAPPLVKIHTCR